MALSSFFTSYMTFQWIRTELDALVGSSDGEIIRSVVWLAGESKVNRLGPFLICTIFRGLPSSRGHLHVSRRLAIGPGRHIGRFHGHGGEGFSVSCCGLPRGASTQSVAQGL